MHYLTRSMKRNLQFIYTGSRRCHEIRFWNGSVIFTCFQTIINNYHLGRPLNAEGFKLFNIALEPFIVHRIREGCRTPIFGIDIPQVSKKYSSKLLQEWYNTYKYSINILSKFYLILYSPKKQLYYLRIQCYTKHWVYAHRDLNRYCWYHG